jgi:hypothetical protein
MMVLKGMLGLSGIYVKDVTLTGLLKLEVATLKLIPFFTNSSRLNIAVLLLVSILSLPLIFFKNSHDISIEIQSVSKYLFFMIVLFLTSILFMNSFSESEFLYFDF